MGSTRTPFLLVSGASVSHPTGSFRASEPKTIRLTVEKGGARLDTFLRDSLAGSGEVHEGSQFSREKIKRLIRDGAVTADGNICDTPKVLLKRGSVIVVTLPHVETCLAPEAGDLVVVYEDACLAVLDKPAGLTVHPCPSCPEGTLAHRLVAHFPSLRQQEGFRPGIVHRLDKDTSGLIVAALTEEARLALSAMFAGREVAKEYLALVHGVPALAEGCIEAPLGRHPTNKVKMAVHPGGREATTLYRVLEADECGRFALVAVRILTGRTHQIRVHMAHIGHPLLGDKLYRLPERPSSPAQTTPVLPCSAGQWPLLPSLPSLPRQMLHAWQLSFMHPIPSVAENAQMAFTCPPPADFAETVTACAQRPFRAVLTGMPGSGKSTLLNALADLGLPTFSSDAAVKKLYRNDGEGHAFLRARYGERFMRDEDAGAGVDSVALGQAMHASPGLRREVEQFIHPLVFDALRKFWHEHSNAPLTVAEVPLFFETLETPYGLQGLADTVINVHCPFALREKRLAERRGWDASTIAMMESWQRPEDEKNRRSHLVVDNIGSADELEAKAIALQETLFNRRREHCRKAAERFVRHWAE